MTIDIEQLRKDREAGTKGFWRTDGVDDNSQPLIRADHFAVATCWHHCVGSIEKESHANARRIARVPDMEARILADAEALKAADELAEALEFYSLVEVEFHGEKVALQGGDDGGKRAHAALAAYRKARGNQ